MTADINARSSYFWQYDYMTQNCPISTGSVKLQRDNYTHKLMHGVQKIHNLFLIRAITVTVNLRAASFEASIILLMEAAMDVHITSVAMELKHQLPVNY